MSFNWSTAAIAACGMIAAMTALWLYVRALMLVEDRLRDLLPERVAGAATFFVGVFLPFVLAIGFTS
jgi:uncharacterized protein involved in response to NO